MSVTTSVDVTLCTFRRPIVRDALLSLEKLDLPAGVELRIIVADNDDSPSGEELVQTTADEMTTPVHYVHAPSRNISIARNAALEAATADWVAFIDDDEVAEPDWLARLLARAAETDADAIFGPAVAEYGPDAPDWMRRQDHHSNRPVYKAGAVEIGFTCNALVRWAGMPWVQQRFDLGKGKSGGEDVDFFFALKRMGATFDADEDAIVREAVHPSRLNLSWLLRRKFNAGSGHSSKAQSLAGRLRLGASATAKATYCGLRMAAAGLSEDRRNYWMLRGALHMGVVSGCFALQPRDIYGK
ncbi:MAG: glycosyltransferase family 2 protein [Pseudomonadota bacterium]